MTDSLPRLLAEGLLDEQHSRVADPCLVDGIGPALGPESPARGNAYWSQALAAHYRGSGFIEEGRGAYSRPDIGAYEP